MPRPRLRLTLAGLMALVALIAVGIVGYQEWQRRQPVNRLIDVLKRGDATARRQAADDLGRMGRAAGPAVPDLLIGLKGDPDPECRMAAAVALSRILAHAPAAAEQALLPALEDQALIVREAAIVALLDLDSKAPELLTALARAMLDPEVRQGRPVARYGADPWELLALRRPPLDPILTPLRQGLASPDPSVRITSARFLGRAVDWLGGEEPRLADALIPRLADPDLEVRYQVVGAIRRLSERAYPRAAEVMVRSLRADLDLRDPGAPGSGEAWSPRLEGALILAQALPTIGHAADAVVVLKEALRAEDPRPRLLSIYLLGRIGTPAADAVPEIIEALDRPGSECTLFDSSSWVPNLGNPEFQGMREDMRRLPSGPGPRAVALVLQALRRIDPQAPEAAIAELIRRVDSPDPDRSGRAVTLLGCIGPEAKAGLPALLGWIDRRMAASGAGGGEDTRQMISLLEALGRVGGGDPRVVNRLAGLAGSDDAGLRLAALATLGAIGPDASIALPALIQASRHDDPATRRLAIHALGQLGLPAEPIVEVLVARLGDEDAWARTETVRALSSYGPDGRAAIPVAIELLRSVDADQRRLAARSLAAFGGNAAPDAVPGLIGRLDDQDPQVASAVGMAFDAVQPIEVQTIDEVRDRLRSPSPSTRVSAAADLARLKPFVVAIEGIDDPLDVVPVLRERLAEDDEPHVRATVAAVLGHLGGAARSATPDLLEAVADPDPIVRQAVAGALARVAPERPETLEALIARLDGEGDAVQIAAIEALGRLALRAQAVAPELRRRLGDPRASESLRLVLRDALRRIDPDGAAEPPSAPSAGAAEGLTSGTTNTLPTSPPSPSP